MQLLEERADQIRSREGTHNTVAEIMIHSRHASIHEAGQGGHMPIGRQTPNQLNISCKNLKNNECYILTPPCQFLQRDYWQYRN